LVETVAEIVAAHRGGMSRPADTVQRSYRRLRERDDAAIFISLRDESEAVAEAQELARHGDHHRPLFGVPVAIKDNIDVDGLATTAACPAFAYQPARDAAVVARLRQAGAIIIGKTNLDQFATGLVGVRSPYGVPRNAINPELVPGGSSSGSAVAVAAGIVPLALGTDTAGSGRVPAGLNNIVGLKPSLGLISTSGVLPACRTLDCVSIFALTVDDAWTALDAIAGYDREDPYSRALPLGSVGVLPQGLRLGVPADGQRQFFGNATAAASYMAAVEQMAKLGATIVTFDMEPFYETARLLYEGPWLAERYLVIRSLLASDPEAVHPVTRAITEGGAKPSAADAFEAFYRLEALRRIKDEAFQHFDAMLLPTAPDAYTIAAVDADPIGLNSRLGTYTNFVNLLDMCGLAVPASLGADGVPRGVTLLAPAGRDALLASIGRAFHADTGLPLGALGVPQPALMPVEAEAGDDGIAIAVVGAHLSGMPLNGELIMHGGRLLETTTTAADYRLFALGGAGVRKPGLLRVAPGEGVGIEVELWRLPAAGFGLFVAVLPQPMAIGTLTLHDGRGVKGFLVEPEAVKGAADISRFGGWRAFLASADPK